MKLQLKILVLLGLVAGLTLILGHAPAGAHKKKFPKSVTMSFQRSLHGTDRFSGHVTSPNPRCTKGALIQLAVSPAFPGGGGSGEPQIVATAGTDFNGRWVIGREVTGFPTASFTFEARSPRMRLKSKKGRHKHVCKAAVSPPETISGPPPSGPPPPPVPPR